MVLVAIIFATTLVFGLPMAFVLGATGVAHLFAMDNPIFFNVIIQRMFGGVNNFSLMAIPFFIMAGELMNKGGITERIMGFIRECVGSIRGGLAYATVLVAMILSAILGSANAVAAILCAVVVPAMIKDGYDDDFSVATVASAGVLGPIIPPSISFIIYGVLTGVSVSGLFMAGIIPGLLIGLSYMTIIYIFSKKRNYPRLNEDFSIDRLGKSFIKAAPSMLVPVIIVGGVMTGIFTPTESGAVAVAVALISGLAYRTLKISELPDILLRTGITTAGIMVIVAFGNIMGWTMAMDQIPAKVSEAILSFTSNPQVVMLLILLVLIVVGMLMEAFAATYIFVPVFAPLAAAVGIDPMHFGVIFSIMLVIGLITPPVGMVLFVTSNITKVPLGRINKMILPFALAAFVVTFAMAFLPDVVLWIPRLLGQ